MSRLHLFELEDQRWFPIGLRNLMTGTMQYAQIQFKIYEATVPLLVQILQHMQTNRVVDLCTGASGPWLSLQHALRLLAPSVSVMLTDKYPNLPALEEASARSAISLEVMRQPVDALAVPTELAGVRTLFNAFHHFKPEEARAILKDAADHQAAICVFEMTERNLLGTLMLLPMLPLVSALAAFQMRPITSKRLFWTFVIPLVPLLGIWDGIVSNLRTYTPQELETMAASLQARDYTWEAGMIPTPLPNGRITYLVGYPATPVPVAKTPGKKKAREHAQSRSPQPSPTIPAPQTSGVWAFLSQAQAKLKAGLQQRFGQAERTGDLLDVVEVVQGDENQQLE